MSSDSKMNDRLSCTAPPGMFSMNRMAAVSGATDYVTTVQFASIYSYGWNENRHERRARAARKRKERR